MDEAPRSEAGGPAAAPDADPVAALVRANRARGVDPEAWTAGGEWDWRSRGIPEEVLRRLWDSVP